MLNPVPGASASSCFPRQDTTLGDKIDSHICLRLDKNSLSLDMASSSQCAPPVRVDINQSLVFPAKEYLARNPSRSDGRGFRAIVDKPLG